MADRGQITGEVMRGARRHPAAQSAQVGASMGLSQPRWGFRVLTPA